MQAITRRKLAMARSALEFVSAHPVADTGFTTIVARLTDALARATTASTQENDGQVGQHAAVAKRRLLRRTIRQQQLTRLVRVADLAFAGEPDLAGLFILPAVGVPNNTFLVAARSLLAAATEHEDVLLTSGLGQTFLAELGTALDQFDASTASEQAGRGDHVGARAAFRSLMRECMTDVSVLGSYYRTTSPDDADLLAAWASASHVAGPFRRQAPVPAPAPAPAPTPTPNPGEAVA